MVRDQAIVSLCQHRVIRLHRVDKFGICESRALSGWSSPTRHGHHECRRLPLPGAEIVDETVGDLPAAGAGKDDTRGLEASVAVAGGNAAAPVPLMVTSRKFIEGLPMKPATN